MCGYGFLAETFPALSIKTKNLKIPEAWIQQISKQAEAEYPHECCGLILCETKNPQVLTRVVPCRNRQEDYHKQDPAAFPRTAGQAYWVDPQELLSIHKSMRKTGEQIRVIYHSHMDAGAYFSEEDQRMALDEGRPVYPGVDYLVMAVKKGKTHDSKLYCWDASTKQFKGANLAA